MILICIFLIVPDLMSNQEINMDAENEESGDDWDEVNEEYFRTICLFCQDEFGGYVEATKHLKSTHFFDLSRVIRDYRLDDYSFRKFINFVRKNKLSPDEVSSRQRDWDSNDYLTPVIQDDAWLMFGNFICALIKLFT